MILKNTDASVSVSNELTLTVWTSRTLSNDESRKLFKYLRSLPYARIICMTESQKLRGAGQLRDRKE